ncbi:hypothetical protein Tco_0942534 [Tanacetum coccineum]
MTETMKKYMSKTRGNYGSGVARPKIGDKTHFELKGQFLKELHENTFSGSEHEDANKHIKKVLEIVDLFHIPEVTQDQIMLRAFPMSLTRAASHWLRNESLAWGKTIKFDYKLGNPENEVSKQKVNKKVYVARSDANYAKDRTTQRTVHTKKREKNLEEAYYTQFGTPYQPGGQYRAAGPGFYQHNNENSSYPDRRQTLEESLTKFMAESAKRHEENSNIIKEI